MALPAPNLDDRRFQQLVDEAKRYVQQRCPEWTDHNVSDPGVTLIETFAHMVEQLVYRLNRVPEKNYRAFLDLLGITLFPPSAARADVTFWLSAPQPDVVVLRAGTEVATVRTETEQALVFATVIDLDIVPCTLTRLVTRAVQGEPVDHTPELESGRNVRCFQAAPAAGDTMLLGLSDAVPGCAVAVSLDSRVEGVGVDPRQPPLTWEAWDGDSWVDCEVDHDTTGGLNRPGEVLLHIPSGHRHSVIAGVRAGWLRCRVIEPEPGQPFYSESPTVRSAEVVTVGGTVTAENAETVDEVFLGRSEGVSGQRFRLDRAPVLTDGEPIVVQVHDGLDWQDWQIVEHFGRSSPTDRHVVLDAANGEFTFPPSVREPDGGFRRFGALPPKGAALRVPRYRTGGGRAGNVAGGALSVLRSSVPYIASVVNRAAAAGGVDGETVAEARLRAPNQLRTQDRAVTSADFEQIARLAAPTARIRCLAAREGDAPGDVGGVRVLVVPDAVPDEDDRLRFEQLVPAPGLLDVITRRLDERRLLGTRLIVEPPRYQGLTVVARLISTAADVHEVSRAALRVLYRHLDPLRGGPDGTGWPFGRPVQFGEIFAVLQGVPGVNLVEDVRLLPADPISGRRGTPVGRVDLAEGGLVFGYEHQITVVDRSGEGT
ncbi:putative baseplate assembly protein [Actinoalloteichus hymeniacidonis]|uniref:Baseplate assembly protein n=1 Tax=Actinoalloteichus hymeniacidonis TaxID=340345 RepID=A0AAC9MZP6_9PSEU|nr:putative baseplate assembly protein [Actinoalloteichus hymeniacidonis]AOS64292.1 putative baseplate assembly protein [Actinoalloteichus hymeniacidonis]MBB5907640.1 putative phage baseplate assembly protein [Actinoalloteichus hymeniacidonis]